MAYLIFLILTIALFAGFLLVTAREGKRAHRYFAAARDAFDARVAHVEFIATHVDFAAFVRDSIKALAERVAHDVAHGSLVAVRWTERQLTHAVRTMRERRAEIVASNGGAASNGAPAAPGQASEFARTIADFKQELRAQRPDADAAVDGIVDVSDAVD